MNASVAQFRTPPSNSKEFEKHPAGMTVARCFQIIDLGTHFDERYGKSKHQVRVVFESSKKMEDGRPFAIGQKFTLSHHEKAQLRKTLESWYGKRFDTKQLDQANGFDLAKLLGRPALLNIAHSEDGKYANIISINPVPEGMPIPEPVNSTLLFSLANFDQAIYDKLGKGTKEMIERSEERNPTAKVKTAPTAPADDAGFDDDIPF